jgi:hypothetical protein
MQEILQNNENAQEIAQKVSKNKLCVHLTEKELKKFEVVANYFYNAKTKKELQMVLESMIKDKIEVLAKNMAKEFLGE